MGNFQDKQTNVYNGAAGRVLHNPERPGGLTGEMKGFWELGLT